MFVLYFGMLSMITPPVALAAFAGASLAGASPLQTAMRAVRFGWIAYLLPFLFVFIAAALAGIMVTIYARLDDWRPEVAVVGGLVATLAGSAWTRTALPPVGAAPEAGKRSADVP